MEKERKEFHCLDCNTIFYDDDNCRCKKVHNTSFLLKLRKRKKHAEDIQASIPHVSQTNSECQIQSLNFPTAFFSSAHVENKLHAEKLKNIRDGSHSYLKDQKGEHVDVPVIETSQQNAVSDLSFYPRQLLSLNENDENSLASDCLVGAQYQISDTSEETTNYSILSGNSTPAHEFKYDRRASNIRKSMIPQNNLTQVLCEQDLAVSSFSGQIISGEYRTTGVSIQESRFNNEPCRPESYETRNERNNILPTNILESNRISKNLDFFPSQRYEEPHLLSLPPVMTPTSDIGVNKLCGKNVPLVSEIDGHFLAGPSHGKNEDQIEFRDGRFFCTYSACKKSYRRKRSLIAHFRSHTGERPFACNKCPKAFKEKRALSTHYKIHSDERPYPCNFCERRFFSQVDRDKHQLTHIAERPYACGECPKRFTVKNYLTVHLRTHTGEKKYLCDMCNKRFAMKNSLNRHRKTHFRR